MDQEEKMDCNANAEVVLGQLYSPTPLDPEKCLDECVVLQGAPKREE